MPGYIEGAYKVDDEAALKTLPKSPIYLQEGDVLIWKEKTALNSSGLGAGGRIMLIQFSRGSYFFRSSQASCLNRFSLR